MFLSISKSIISAILALSFVIPGTGAAFTPDSSDDAPAFSRLCASGRFAYTAGALNTPLCPAGDTVTLGRLYAALADTLNSFLPENERITADDVFAAIPSDFSSVLTNRTAAEAIVSFSEIYLPSAGFINPYPALKEGALGSAKRQGLIADNANGDELFLSTSLPLLREMYAHLILGAYADKAAGDIFDEHTLITGDSITYFFIRRYLEPGGLIGDARFGAICGMPPMLFFDGMIRFGDWGVGTYRPEFRGMTYAEMISANDPEMIEKVFIMLGTNQSVEFTAEQYRADIDHILKELPGAVVYMQKVPYGDEGIVDYKAANRKIEKVYNDFLAEGETRVRLVDTVFIGKGNLADGVHLSDNAYPLWIKTLKKAVAENCRKTMLSAERGINES